MMEQEVKLITIRQAAKILNMRVRTIRDWIHRGKIDAVKSINGYRWYVFLDEIEHLAEENHADED